MPAASIACQQTSSESPPPAKSDACSARRRSVQRCSRRCVFRMAPLVRSVASDELRPCAPRGSKFRASFAGGTDTHLRHRCQEARFALCRGAVQPDTSMS